MTTSPVISAIIRTMKLENNPSGPPSILSNGIWKGKCKAEDLLSRVEQQ